MAKRHPSKPKGNAYDAWCGGSDHRFARRSGGPASPGRPLGKGLDGYHVNSVNMRIRNALPDLRETVRSTREVVLSRVDLRSAKINRTLEEGFSRVNDGLNALRTSIPEQLLMTSRYPPLASFVPRCRSSPCGSHHII